MAGKDVKETVWRVIKGHEEVMKILESEEKVHYKILSHLMRIKKDVLTYSLKNS